MEQSLTLEGDGNRMRPETKLEGETCYERSAATSSEAERRKKGAGGSTHI